MVNKRSKKGSKFKKYTGRRLVFNYKKKRFKVLLDNVLIFSAFKKVHGRFWGLAGVLILVIGLTICFFIQPAALTASTAFSDFAKDVRTAPYFAISVFFAAYGLWRWRNYLARTLTRTQPVLTLLGLTIFGLMLVALMPVSWKTWPYRIHLFGITLAGVSIAATVVFDILLSKTRKNQNAYRARLIKVVSFFLIIVGGYLALGSIEPIRLFHVSLIGESLMLGGYAIWVAAKTYQGEDPRSRLSRLLSKVVFIS